MRQISKSKPSEEAEKSLRGGSGGLGEGWEEAWGRLRVGSGETERRLEDAEKRLGGGSGEAERRLEKAGRTLRGCWRRLGGGSESQHYVLLVFSFF